MTFALYNMDVSNSSLVFDLGPVEDPDAIEPTPGSGQTYADFNSPPPPRTAEGVLNTIQNVNRIRDLDTLLEQVLLRARQLVRADAGTIYLKAKNQLFFSYVQNDTLFAGQTPDSRYVYSENSLPVDRSSLAGYVAATGEPLVIDDVYDIKSSVSYAFNPEFDTKSNYRTRSMLIVPLLTRDESLVGVLQLINAIDEDSGESVSFSYQDTLFANQFAQAAADAIERSRMAREMVLRLVELSGLRDPFETGQHAKRVGAYATELYDAWATGKGVDQNEIRINREIIRTAAMLHDVGKVAISDTILRKGNNLTPEERKRMQLHTIYGARLFKRDDSPWDLMAREVTLNHHERWDGTGYPGHTDNIFGRKVRVGRPKKGEEIPVSARIVSIADVYDALKSERAYKDAWPEERVLSFLDREAGQRFDPQLVQIFLGMADVRHSIERKYSY
jgi:HD-GYP domain-containing protein (c-di-GMP phosphodiesterase class II)